MTDAPTPDDDELPILPHPYQPATATAPAPPRRAGVSPLAVSSVLSALLLGPVGAIAAILFGWYARREIERLGAPRAGYAMATAGIVLGMILTPAWGGVLSYFAWTRSYRAEALSAAAPEPPAAAAPPAPGPPAAAAPRPGPSAPRITRVEHAGQITVVDIGATTASLADELARQRAAATLAGETVVVMTTMGVCEPCRGVDSALRDPLMQAALARVRLVRVDVEVFHEDLDALHIPRARMPGFYLLAPDLAPRDGLDGGEWDADVAPNIAPVLGAFVRGKYTARREPWHPAPGSGMAL